VDSRRQVEEDGGGSAEQSWMGTNGVRGLCPTGSDEAKSSYILIAYAINACVCG